MRAERESCVSHPGFTIRPVWRFAGNLLEAHSILFEASSVWWSVFFGGERWRFSWNTWVAFVVWTPSARKNPPTLFCEHPMKIACQGKRNLRFEIDEMSWLSQSTWPSLAWHSLTRSKSGSNSTLLDHPSHEHHHRLHMLCMLMRPTVHLCRYCLASNQVISTTEQGLNIAVTESARQNYEISKFIITPPSLVNISSLMEDETLLQLFQTLNLLVDVSSSYMKSSDTFEALKTGRTCKNHIKLITRQQPRMIFQQPSIQWQ